MNDLTQTMYNLELSLLQPEVRSSREALDKLLADDFLEFGTSGLEYNKSITLEKLPSSQEKVEYTIYDFNAKQLSDDIVQTVYKTDRIINDTDKVTSLRSSLWRNNNGQWQMFFHQGTPARQII